MRELFNNNKNIIDGPRFDDNDFFIGNGYPNLSNNNNKYKDNEKEFNEEYENEGNKKEFNEEYKNKDNKKEFNKEYNNEEDNISRKRNNINREIEDNKYE